jgi:ribonuclease MRP protein subunit RMP1
MAAESANSTVPQSPTSELLNLSRLIDVLYIRNKNQHRRSAWWKHFNIFRKQLKALTISELQQASGGTSKSVEDTKHVPLRVAGERRVDVWVNNLIGAWHAAFTQLLAERRFANLGVVLLAILGRTCWLVGATEKMMEMGRSELVAALESSMPAPDSTKAELQVNREDLSTAKEIMDDVDMGEVISREDINESEAEDTVFFDAVESPSQLTKKVEKRKPDETPKSGKRKIQKPESNRKRKRAKHEIDDIFASFGA